jgi:renalase
MQAPVRQLLDDEEVHLNSTITELAKNEEGLWRLHTAEEGWGEEAYDAVVFAIPAPEVTPLVAPHSTKLAGISGSAVMKGTWALMLQYPQPLQVPFDSAFINQNPLSWVSRDNAKPGRNKSVETWLLHATSAWSDQHIDSSEEEVSSALLTAFCSLPFPSSEFQIARPHAWSAHHWKHATTHPNLDINSAWDEEQQLGVCGDWLNVGKVEGAWLSGRHLARVIHEQQQQSL